MIVVFIVCGMDKLLELLKEVLERKEFDDEEIGFISEVRARYEMFR